MLSLVFFVSAFVVISSISAVDMFANVCLFMFLLGCVLVTYFFENFTFNHRVICTGWSISIEAKSSFSFFGLYKTPGSKKKINK